MSDAARDREAAVVIRALRRTRQVRQFRPDPVPERLVTSLLDVARWTGSSKNRQPWTFIVLRDPDERARVAELAPNARHVASAPVAIAIVMSGENEEWDAYDEGRVAERILIAAAALGLGAGIGWVVRSRRDPVHELLRIEPPAFLRTIVSIGYPTADAARPKSVPGTARRPLSDVVRDDPAG